MPATAPEPLPAPKHGLLLHDAVYRCTRIREWVACEPFHSIRWPFIKAQSRKKPYLSPSFQMLALLDPHVLHLPSPFLKVNSTSGLFAEVTQSKGCSKGSVGCFLFHFVFHQSKAKNAKNRIHASGSEHPSIKKLLRGRGQYPQPQEVTLVGAGLTVSSSLSGSSGVGHAVPQFQDQQLLG